jgi:hypothetical protein
MNIKEELLEYKNSNKSNPLMDNILIAVFMGIKPIKGFNELNAYYYYYNNSKTKDFEAIPNYKNSWDDLMSVVEKINERDWVTIYSDECKIHSLQVNEFEDIIVTREGEPLIKSVYEAVLKYVKIIIKID